MAGKAELRRLLHIQNKTSYSYLQHVHVEINAWLAYDFYARVVAMNNKNRTHESTMQ